MKSLVFAFFVIFTSFNAIAEKMLIAKSNATDRAFYVYTETFKPIDGGWSVIIGSERIAGGDEVRALYGMSGRDCKNTFGDLKRFSDKANEWVNVYKVTSDGETVADAIAQFICAVAEVIEREQKLREQKQKDEQEPYRPSKKSKEILL